jgi:hypothetical protein
MDLAIRFVPAVVLVGHALIHLGYISPRPPQTSGGPPWPFQLERSWLLSPLGFGIPALRVGGFGLLVTSPAAFVVAALAIVGLAPASVWPPAAIIGTATSALLLVLFFHRWLVLGLVIDLVILVGVLVWNWSPAA